MKKLFLLLSLCCISFAAWADEYTDENGVTWEYNLNGYWDEANQTQINGAIITKCSNYGTEIVVPEAIQVDEESYNVVCLEGDIFNDDSESKYSITSVTLPSSLTSIRWDVFNGLNLLKTLNVPEGLTSIGSGAFSGCQSLVLTLPASLKTVEYGAFNSCKMVSLPFTDPVSLGNNISSGYVFDGVSHIAVPDDVIESYKNSQVWTRYAEKICGHSEVVEYTHIDENNVTWTYNYILSSSSVRIVKAEGYSTDIVVPATLPWNEQQLSVTAIEHSFSGDVNIVSVDLSKTSITATPSFQNCSSLESVLLPSTLETISEYTFYNCDNLQSIDLSGTSVKVIDSWAFNGCDNLNTIVFPSTLETIGNYVFESCRKIQGIDLSNTKLTTIGESAFMYCTELNPLSLPTSLKKIGSYAFLDNYALRDLDLSMVEEIGDEAFRFANVLTVDISSATSIGATAFSTDATFTINATTPANIKANSFTENSKFIVTPNAYDTFCSATIWKNWADNISMFHVDANEVKWVYRYLQDTNSMYITAASGYSEEVTIPNTLPYNEEDVTVTHLEGAFNGAGITSVKLPTTLTYIGEYTFNACESLTAVEIPASVTEIGLDAFAKCIQLISVTFEENSALKITGTGVFYGCKALTSIELPASLVTLGTGTFHDCRELSSVTFDANSALQAIGDKAFLGNYALTSINIPASVKFIGDEAFHYCSLLKELDLSKVEEIGERAFAGISFASVDLSSATSVGAYAFSSNDEMFFTVNNTTPAILKSGAFPSNSMFLVPSSATTDYKTANVWSDYASHIFASDIAVQTINVTAQDNGSGVLEAIGGNENQTSIIDLTVKGTINGYDFVMFKDKMTNLRFLDLSEAKIVENPYCYYEQHHSQDDTLGAYAFYQENKLLSIKLPKDIKYIGENAFAGCGKLTEINLPNTITAIGGGAFNSTGLTKIILPNKLERIGSDAFASTQLKEIAFPTTLTTIEWGAFMSCGQLETVRIPSSLQYISDYAFGDCSNLKNVYTYTIEPTDINENTFSNFETAQLYVPTASGQNYYWNEGWKRFVNVAEFDEEYEYFYLNGDHTLDESTGAVDGTPDADLNAGSGLTVEDGVEQNMGDLNIQHDGTNGGSIISGSENGNIHADNLHVNINVQSGRWYFFCFPFDLKKENISMGKEETQYIFRWYDGKERANGNSGWKNVTEEEGSYLKAATGYIFQCSQSDVLTISLADVKFKKEKKYNELVANTAENLQDASWNFVGNPYLSYYDMNSVGYDAPITVWNGETYEAIKPGDDDYHFAPFEAFFVQKPEGTDAMEFDADAQTTLQGSQTETRATGARAITRAINPNRKLVNIVLSNGEKSDRTRIVFNDKVSMEYELACDAAKFDATGVPQLYTIDNRAVKYAINERPVAEGIVTVGYSAPAEGIYTLEAPRMDTPVYVKDNLTRTIHNFSEGSYEFYSEAGTFEGRFTILTKSGVTGIDGVELDEQNDERIYNLNGQRVNKATGKGIYIKNNRKEVNM